MKIVNKIVQEQISFSDAFKAIRSQKGGIIAAVYGGRVGILDEDRCLNGKSRWGFRHLLVTNSYIDANTMTDGGVESLQHRLENLDHMTEYHYFATTQDFARAVIENGWK